jgi:hypothetical protein
MGSAQDLLLIERRHHKPNTAILRRDRFLGSWFDAFRARPNRSTSVAMERQSPKVRRIRVTPDHRRKQMSAMILSWNALAMSDMGVMLATTDHEVRTSRKAMAPTEKLTLVYNAVER